MRCARVRSSTRELGTMELLEQGMPRPLDGEYGGGSGGGCWGRGWRWAREVEEGGGQPGELGVVDWGAGMGGGHTCVCIWRVVTAVPPARVGVRFPYVIIPLRLRGFVLRPYRGDTVLLCLEGVPIPIGLCPSTVRLPNRHAELLLRFLELGRQFASFLLRVFQFRLESLRCFKELEDWIRQALACRGCCRISSVALLGMREWWVVPAWSFSCSSVVVNKGVGGRLFMSLPP